MSDHAAYKAAKEAFFHGLQGSTHWEVFILAQCMPLLVCLGRMLARTLCPLLSKMDLLYDQGVSLGMDLTFRELTEALAWTAARALQEVCGEWL